MPEYSGLKIDPLGDILVCPRIKTHGQCERHSPRPGKQTITPRVALSGRSIILFYLYIFCIGNNTTIECASVYIFSIMSRILIHVMNLFLY